LKVSVFRFHDTMTSVNPPIDVNNSTYAWHVHRGIQNTVKHLASWRQLLIKSALNRLKP